jgi:flagellar basal body-associated protein FliL
MAEQAAKSQPQPGKKSSSIVMLAMILGVAVLQAGVFFALVKFAGGGPAATYGAQNGQHVAQTQPAAEEAAAKPETAPGGGASGHGGGEKPAEASGSAAPATGAAEVVLLQRFKVPNSKGGTTILYDFDISVVVPAARKAAAEEIFKNRAAEISDRVAQIVRQAAPRVLAEDDFATLRGLLKQVLGEITGDGQMVQRVLIPRCVPLRAG